MKILQYTVWILSRFLLPLSLALLFCACGSDDPIGPGARKPTPDYLGNDADVNFASKFGIGDTLAIDSGFQISFGETTYDSARGAHRQFLRLRTTQWYFCSNQFILTQVQVSSGRITIDVIGVQIPSLSFADAFKQSEITELFEMKPGSYEIEIRYRTDTSVFRMAVTDSTLSVNKKSGDSFELQGNLFWRYKSKTFAFVCGHLTQDSSACDLMLDTLLSTLSLRSYTYPDSGMRPYPSSIPGSYIDWVAQYYQYDAESDYDSAGEALHAYGKMHWAWNSGNLAYIVDYRGKMYMSWSPR